MSIFKQPQSTPTERPPMNDRPISDRPLARPETPPAEAGTSVIATGMKVTGDIETNGVIKVEGTIEGSIRGARQVLLSRTGVIQGDIHADEMALAGRVIGTITALERVEVQSTCRIEGDINTKSIVVIEGGSINGSVRMEEATSRSASPGMPTPSAKVATVAVS